MISEGWNQWTVSRRPSTHIAERPAILLPTSSLPTRRGNTKNLSRIQALLTQITLQSDTKYTLPNLGQEKSSHYNPCLLERSYSVQKMHKCGYSIRAPPFMWPPKNNGFRAIRLCSTRQWARSPNHRNRQDTHSTTEWKLDDLAPSLTRTWFGEEFYLHRHDDRRQVQHDPEQVIIENFKRKFTHQPWCEVQ